MAKATFQQLRKLGGRSSGRPAEPMLAVVAGANANTDIPITGIKTNDVLVSCVELAGPGEAAGQPAAVDRTAQTTISSAGNIRVSVATNTSADRRLLVSYYKI